MDFSHRIFQLIGKCLARKRLSILIYHQVLAEFDPMRPSEPTVESFEWQMRLLNKFFTPLSLTQALEAIEKDTLPANAVCVTFDDGYINNLTVAQPILAKYQIPATVYVATGFSDGSNMFNDRILDLIGDEAFQSFDLSDIGLSAEKVSSIEGRLHLAHKVIGKVKYLPFKDRAEKVDTIYQTNNADEYARRMMDVEQIKKLSRTGIDIGAHTHDHPILASLPPEEQHAQLLNSKHLLENIVEQPVSHFAYPNGKLNDDYSNKTVQLVKQAKFASAVTTHWGISTKESDTYQLKRFTPWDTNSFKFHMRLMLNQIKGAW